MKFGIETQGEHKTILKYSGIKVISYHAQNNLISS